MTSRTMPASDMAFTRDRGSRGALYALLSTTAVVFSAPAFAQSGQPLAVPAVGVEEDAPQEYKVESPASPKYTAPLLDTPQTITVIPQAVIKDQNLLSLRDVLSTVPGITFGAGEGGGGYGDSVNLRGYTASSDITVDGVRDTGQYSRSDVFNLEQVEVVSGANSVYAGSGGVGGSINLVTKVPRAETFTDVSAGVGTANYFRGTVDSNQQISDTIAIRINAMGHKNDVPGRDVEDYKRWGIAPSVAFGLGTPTRFTLSYLHQVDNNIPQYGIPYFVNAFSNGLLPGVATSNYYGYSNVDTQEIDLDVATAIIEHDFSDTFHVRNLTRWQEVTQLSIANQPQGTWCLSNGTNLATGAACTPAGFLLLTRGGTTRDGRNQMLYNQTDVSMQFATGGISHSLVVGASVSTEDYALANGNSLRTPTGGTVTLPPMSIANPDHVYTGPVNFIQSGSTDASLNNQAIYAFDAIKFSEQLEFNGGVRLEHNEGTNTLGTFSTAGVFTSQGPVLKNSDDLFSYRAGLVYKPIPDASLYIAYGNSRTPSKTSVNGACTAANCFVEPETAKSYEIGAKWNLFEDQLSLTASVFRNARTNFRVTSADTTIPEQQVDGSARVDGAALGAAGTITPEWMVFANYTYLDSKVIRSIPLIDISRGIVDPQAGNPMVQTPKHAMSFWTTYQLPYNVQLGYGFTQQSKIYVTSAAPLVTAPGYWTHRAMVSYAPTENLSVQVNATNLFNKLYLTRVRYNATSPWTVPGDKRQVTLSVNYSF
ncbi:MAG: TonB-dependent receptor [Rhodospirillaceae bacterium]